MLILPHAPRAELEGLVRAGHPHETCGVLVGSPRPGGGARVERVVACRNLNTERARDRYDLDPDDYLQAEIAARRDGLEIVGIWHSHPDHPARPSETDRAAAWEGWSYLILSVAADGVRDVRSWRLDGVGFAEEDIQTEEPVES